MPRIKRWFPVSHDINRDPEMWDLCAKFGDKALRCWLEILSIADRNEGEVPGPIKGISTQVAWAIRSKTTKVDHLINAMTSLGWLTNKGTLKVANYSKYHITREDKKLPLASLPSEPSEPTRPKRDKNLSSSPPSLEAIEISQLLSDLIFRNFPNRTPPTEAQLTSWARDADKINRSDGHAWGEIRELLEWCQDDNFWRANILSMSKFREKWNQLVAKRGSGGNGVSRIDAEREAHRKRNYAMLTRGMSEEEIAAMAKKRGIL
jgi:hypothetical protein